MGNVIELLDEKEAAKILRVQTGTLSNWRVSGRGPRFRKIGRRVFYSPDDLLNFFAAAARDSTSDNGLAGTYSTRSRLGA